MDDILNATLIQLITQIIQDNPQFVVYPNYEELIFKQIIKNDLFKEPNIQSLIGPILTDLKKERCSTSYSYDCIDASMQYQINFLQNAPQPMQKTTEWYKFRNEHITASNAWKAFGSQPCQNQLIYEKCKAFTSISSLSIDPSDENQPSHSNLAESSLTWGHKYEPLTRMLYESMNQTLIQDFGCIEHPQYSFLAASPDGIVVGPINYGRMIEIKNVVSREINGIPKLEYYIQTQLQMEVCNLPECDFVETKFKEFDSYQEFIIDTSDKKKGIIMVYVENGEYVYYYMPFNIVVEEDINTWLDTNMNNPGEWIKNVYWSLEVYSCVLIKRQIEWFQYAIPILQNIWQTICVERIGDYSLRAPKKRNNK